MFTSPITLSLKKRSLRNISFYFWHWSTLLFKHFPMGVIITGMKIKLVIEVDRSAQIPPSVQTYCSIFIASSEFRRFLLSYVPYILVCISNQHIVFLEYIVKKRKANLVYSQVTCVAFSKAWSIQYSVLILFVTQLILLSRFTLHWFLHWLTMSDGSTGRKHNIVYNN